MLRFKTPEDPLSVIGACHEKDTEATFRRNIKTSTQEGRYRRRTDVPISKPVKGPARRRNSAGHNAGASFIKQRTPAPALRLYSQALFFYARP
jgi:hypothetical protein